MEWIKLQNDRNNLFKFTYVHANLLEFCALINPIQTGSVTSNSLRNALLASNCIPVSTEIKEIIYCKQKHFIK